MADRGGSERSQYLLVLPKQVAILRLARNQVSTLWRRRCSRLFDQLLEELLLMALNLAMAAALHRRLLLLSQQLLVILGKLDDLRAFLIHLLL